MPQTFVIFRIPGMEEPSPNGGAPAAKKSDKVQEPPEKLLIRAGYEAESAPIRNESIRYETSADTVLLDVRFDQLSSSLRLVRSWRNLPILWWADRLHPGGDCRFDPGIDGILFAGMSQSQLRWAVNLAFRHYLNRMDWAKEREQLLSRLEERKWIEKAKGIICRIKNIGEAEAYEYLRTQAMNDRKRLAEVAVSIVKVYELLEENRSGRR